MLYFLNIYYCRKLSFLQISKLPRRIGVRNNFYKRIMANAIIEYITCIACIAYRNPEGISRPFAKCTENQNKGNRKQKTEKYRRGLTKNRFKTCFCNRPQCPSLTICHESCFF